jgi:hypothetical protein
MTDDRLDPPRWKEREDQLNLAERSAGRAFRMLRPAELSEPQLARVAASIRAARPNRSRTWLVVAFAFVLGVASAASAARLDVVRAWLTSTADVHTVVPARPAPVAGHTPRRPAQPPAETTLPSHELRSEVSIPSAPSPAEARGERARTPLPGSRRDGWRSPGPVPEARRDFPQAPTPRPDRQATAPLTVERGPAAELPGAIVEQSKNQPSPAGSWAPPSAPAQPAPGELALVDAPTSNRATSWHRSTEAAVPTSPSRFLTEAIRILRSDRSPEAALALLDLHGADLDKSAYAHEALLVRVEILLSLHRTTDVLRLLDTMPLADVAASHTLLVTRGKLRAAANRCGEGLGDFDLVLAKSQAPDKQALYGRAVCRKRLGDAMGARVDLEKYRRAFPGPSAAALERELGGT